MKPQNKIMLSTAKQAETNAFESVRATPFTRVHRRPTRCNYEVLKEEACAPASEVDDITYAWSKNVMDNYGLLTNILGVDEYNDLTGIATYAIPHEPASYDPNITDATPTHTRKQMEEEGNSFGPRDSFKKASCMVSSTASAMPSTNNIIPNSATG